MRVIGVLEVWIGVDRREWTHVGADRATARYEAGNELSLRGIGIAFRNESPRNLRRREPLDDRHRSMTGGT